MQNIVFFDGQFLKIEEAKISLIEPGFLYGWSLFETMRAYRKMIVYFKQHLERMKEGVSWLSLELPYSFKKTKEIIFKLIDLNRIKDAYVRLTLFKNLKEKTSIFIWVKSYQPYPKSKYLKGLNACVSNFRLNTDPFWVKLKSGNYLFYQLSYLDAKRRGFDEAVILNNRGYITEASRSNIFFVKENKLFTPSLECGCLKGITRQVVMDIAKRHSIELHQACYTLEDLLEADEAFLTNSLMGIIPLKSINGYKIGGSLFKLTSFFMQHYNSLLKYGK